MQEYVTIVILVAVMPDDERRSIEEVWILSIDIIQLADSNSKVIVIETPLMGEDGLLDIIDFPIIIVHPHLRGYDYVVEIEIPIVGQRKFELSPDVIQIGLAVGKGQVIGSRAPLNKSSSK